MDIIVHFPDELGEEISKLPDRNEFLIEAARLALQKKWVDEQTMISLQQIESGELASDEEVEEVFKRLDRK